ncbi:catechol dioxygenase [Dactylonectria macrodidyma]|uniref:Catechol dioxygenase n=1 Tax=Dactylonectria macrodidyma TaxID=307937 RepID=A0A9P9JDX3_9HYPO|nr:catechol dioxygenase [Dactylonectria macrodidyma]
MSPIQQRLPELNDLATDNITENVLLVVHVHDFARETRLSTEKLMAGIQFLTQVDQTCPDVRQEFVLLSDILRLSLLVDSIDHPKPPAGTEGRVLGPFRVHEAPSVQNESQEADNRCVIRSDPTSSLWFEAIVPVPYPIPNDGPVGKLLCILGFDPLITALYIKDSLYENSDAVFGVKAVLVVQLEPVDDVQARTYGVKEGTKLLRYDFVLD